MLTVHHHALALYHRVRELESACRFLEEVLGFETSSRGPGWAVVENGALTLRLVESPAADGKLEIELRTPDLAASERQLAAVAGLDRLGDLEEVEPGRCEQRFTGPHGIVIILVRQASAEELGIEPPLPMNLPWQDGAIELVRSALRFVPYSFRGGALRRTAGRAEALVLARGEVEVGEHDAHRALLEVTPDFQLERLRQELRRLGRELPVEALEEPVR